MTSKTNDLEVLRYTYRSDGLLLTRWSAAMGTTTYDYDDGDNLINIDYPSSRDVDYSYDALSRLRTMTDALGTTTFSYDPANRTMVEAGPWPNSNVTNKLNTAGLVNTVSVQQPSGHFSATYNYDGARRLSTVSSAAGNFTYYYNPGLNSLSTAASLVHRLSLHNGAFITNTFDNQAHLTGTYLRNSAGFDLNSHEYLVNNAHQRYRHTLNVFSSADYLYDDVGQLVDAYGSLHDLSYGYDAAGNLLNRTNYGTVTSFAINSLNQISNGPGGAYIYDRNGNLVSASGGGTLYHYDDENQLTNIQSGTTFKSEFVYDGKNRLRLRRDYAASGGAAEQALVTGVTPSATVRNNFDGWLGYRFTVGGAPMMVSQLGRWVRSGNTGAHEVKIVNSGGYDIPGASVTINTAGAPAGSFKYAPLSSPITLAGC